VLGVRRWRELVKDRGKWRGIVREAKPTVGCSTNGRRTLTDGLFMYLGYHYLCLGECCFETLHNMDSDVKSHFSIQLGHPEDGGSMIL
jgi:hypothetical protein